MNKNQFVEKVAPRLGGRRLASQAVETVLDEIVRAVTDGQPVSITGFGVFEPVERSARGARNPQTGERVTVEPRTAVRFRPGQNFADLVNGDKPLPEGSAVAKAPKGSLQDGAK